MENDNKKTIRVISGIFALASFFAAIILQKSIGYFCSISDSPSSLEYSLSKVRDLLVILFSLTFPTFVFLMLRRKFSLLTSSFATVMADSIFFLFSSIGMYISVLNDPISISTMLIASSSIIVGLTSLSVLLISSLIFTLIKFVLYVKSKITQN